MANITFEDLVQGFGVVTVMNACIYELGPDYRYAGRKGCSGAASNALTPDAWVCTGEYLDTLKIANLTQEGPTKTVTGGQYANPLIKYGKTMTMEMQDALGRASTMVRFFGCDYAGTKTYVKNTKYKFPIVGDGTTKEFKIAHNAASSSMASGGTWTVEDSESSTAPTVTAAYDATNKCITATLSAAPAKGDSLTIVFTVNASNDVVVNGSGRISITDKFPGAFAIEGDTFFIDQKSGEKITVHIFIPQFIPDGIFNLTQDSEGDATVFDLNGSVSVTEVADAGGADKRSIFYEIRETPYFQGLTHNH